MVNWKVFIEEGEELDAREIVKLWRWVQGGSSCRRERWPPPSMVVRRRVAPLIVKTDKRYKATLSKDMAVSRSVMVVVKGHAFRDGFGGEDTNVFIDDEKLRRREKVSPSLLRVIE
ncbi:hypothetical protein VNO77_25953 [Canavalia gladiata]|uniref:Uncharacterized protein n=1 Tax=Canavalia gladiata TaxID=3824 RepID=A0AAN9KUD5_CANGL